MKLALALALALRLAAAGPAAAADRDSTARDTSAVRGAAHDTTHRTVVPADSLPSSDARAVLRTIPEPLTPAERTPPAGSRAASAAPADTTREAPHFAPPDTAAADTSGVPTPAPTAPLGEGPEGPRRTLAATDSGAIAPPLAGPPASPPPATAAAADTCWRLQIGAFAERPVAESHRAAAVSQLIVPMTIESDHGRWKIRSTECLTRAAANALRRRALDSGFRDAFLFRMGPGGEAIPLSPPAAAPAAKPKTVIKRTSHTPAGAVPAARTPVKKKKPAVRR